MAGRFRRDEQGASALASFTVALGLFSLSFSAILVMVANVDGHESGTDLQKSGETAGVLDMLVGSPGSPPDWEATVPTRLGLLKQGSTATLDLPKITSMRDWVTPTEYNDARSALGIDNRELFVRTFPVYLNDAASDALRGYRVGYVADYQSMAPAPSALIEGRALDNLSVTFTNTLADRTGQGLAGDVFQDTTTYTTRQLPLRLAGFPGALDVDTGAANDGWWKVVRPADYGWEGPLPKDGSTTLSQVLTVSTWTGTTYSYSAFAGTSVSEDLLNLGEFDLRAYDATHKISLEFSHFASGHSLTGFLNPLTDDYGFVVVTCKESCRTGDNVPAVRGGNHWNNGTAAAFSPTKIDLSRYYGEKISVALVWHSVLNTGTGKGWFTGPLTLTVTPTGSAPASIWSNRLDYTSGFYDALVVGSGVDQEVLDDAAGGGVLTDALADWVKAGGHLFAFGSEEIENGWLNGLFTSPGSKRVTGPALLSASDLSHPILNTPTRLRPGDLANSLAAYNPHANLRAVMVAPELAGGTVPLLSVSRPSPSYEGVAVLTSYLPWLLPPGTQEAFLVNSFLYAKFNPLYADFGAPAGVPYGGAVSAESRVILVDASSAGLGTLEAQVIAFVW